MSNQDNTPSFEEQIAQYRKELLDHIGEDYFDSEQIGEHISRHMQALCGLLDESVSKITNADPQSILQTVLNLAATQHSIIGMYGAALHKVVPRETYQMFAHLIMAMGEFLRYTNAALVEENPAGRDHLYGHAMFEIIRHGNNAVSTVPPSVQPHVLFIMSGGCGNH